MHTTDITAAGSDGQHLLPAVQRTEAETGVTVERVLADGAYGSGQNLEACAQRPDQPIDLVTPCHRPTDPEIHESVFHIDPEAKAPTCPQGIRVSGKERQHRQSRPFLEFLFRRDCCEACPLFARCVHSKRRERSARIWPHETYLQAEEERHQTAGFLALYRQRSRWGASSASWSFMVCEGPVTWGTRSGSCNVSRWRPS